MFSNLNINIFCNKLYLFLFYYVAIIEMLHNSLRRDQTLTEIMLLIFKTCSGNLEGNGFTSHGDQLRFMVRLLIFTHVFLKVENVSDILNEFDTLSCYFDSWINLLVIIFGNSCIFTNHLVLTEFIFKSLVLQDDFNFHKHQFFLSLLLREIDAEQFSDDLFFFFSSKERSRYYILKLDSKGKERSVREENINTQKMNTTFYITKSISKNIRISSYRRLVKNSSKLNTA